MSIQSAAIRLPDSDEIFEGVTHGEAFNKMNREQQRTFESLSNTRINEISGFTTSEGKFVDVKAAEAIADESAQIIGAGPFGGRELFAEDMDLTPSGRGAARKQMVEDAVADAAVKIRAEGFRARNPDFGLSPERATHRQVVEAQSRSSNEIQLAHNRAGGSTFDPRTGQDMAGEPLIAVAMKPGDDAVISGARLSRQDVDGFISDNWDELSQEGAVVGTWRRADDEHVMDVVRTFPEEQAQDALALAQKNDQDAVFNLLTGEEIPLPRADGPGITRGEILGEGGSQGVRVGQTIVPKGGVTAQLDHVDGETFDFTLLDGDGKPFPGDGMDATIGRGGKVNISMDTSEEAMAAAGKFGPRQVRQAGRQIIEAIEATGREVTALEGFKGVEIRHVPREQNTEADRLVNRALDQHLNGHKGRGPGKGSNGSGGTFRIK